MIASLRKRHDRVSPWGPLRLAGYFLIGAAAVSPALAIHLEVSATSSSSGGFNWLKTIDDSGMSGDTRTMSDLQSTNGTDMALSGGGNAPHFVRYDLGQAVPLDEMWIWNYNIATPISDPPEFAKGMKTVVIDYSVDGGVFTPIFSGELPVATERGEADSPVDLIVEFNAAMARFVRITTAAAPNHNYAVGEIGLSLWNDSGLSEVRFYKAIVTVPSAPVNEPQVIPVMVPADPGVRYNLERATGIDPPDWQETGTFIVGTGADMTLYHPVTNDTVAYFRAAAVGLETILGVPTEENGWTTESTVSARASSEFQNRTALKAINGTGVTTNGFDHGINASTMWLANLFNANPRGGTVPGGHWIEFKFTEPFPVGSMQIWNYCENPPGNLWQWTGLGIKSATIQYTTVGGGGGWGSDTPGDWTTIFQGDLTPHASPHPASGVFPMSDDIPFGDTMVQYVVLTATGGAGIC
jgi:hypothetical protein